MFEYVDSLGQIYTEDDINKMAAEQKTSADAIIRGKKLKQKSTKNTVTPKPKQKTYPWSDGQTKKEPGFLDEFKKSSKAKKTNIKKNTEKVSNFVGKQNDLSQFYQEDPIQEILNPKSELEKTLATLPAGPVKQDWEKLQDKEDEVVNYIKSKPIDYALIDKLYNDEINDSQTIDYVREGAKNFFNDVVLSPISMVGQAIGADIDLTISPFKPLERQKKEAIEILSKTKKKGAKVTNEEIDALAKDLFYKEKILIQEGKAAEEYWDEQPLYISEVAEQKEKLKIRAAQDVLVSSDLARQQTVLAKTYNNDITSFEKYAEGFKAKYDSGDVTDEEIAKYEVRRENAKKSLESLKGVYDNFPKYIDKIKSDEEKLEYFKYNYEDVTANLSRLAGTSLNIVGGTGKILGSTIEYIEGDKAGLGGLLSEASGDTIKLGNKIKEDTKQYSFEDVNSFSDFGKYSFGLIAEQLPVYASMYFGGNYGAAAVSLGSGGQKIQEMEDEVGFDYDLGTKLLAGYGFALAEFVPEKLGTLRMFDNMKKVMSSMGSQPRKMFKDSFIKSSLYTAGLVGVESQIEGGTEVVTEGLDMLIDEHLLGVSITPSDRAKRFKEAYVAGAFMGGGMQMGGGVSTLVAKELKNYATAQEMAASKNIIDRIDYLQNELQTNTRLSGKEADEIKIEINRLSNESLKVIENSRDRVYDMPAEDMTAVLEINKKQQDTKDAYIELSQSNFSPEIKKEKATELKEQFNELERQREFLLTGKYAMINKIVGNRAIINSSVENIKKIVAGLGEENINNRIGDQGSIAVFENVDELKKAYKEWVTVENNNTKKAIASGELPTNTAIKSDEQINSEVEEVAKSDGFSLPNGQSVVNLSVASRTGAINVAQHEFLHKVLAKALSNPQERKKVVNGFLSVLTKKERDVIQKRINENYLDKETGTIKDEDLEEYFTAFIDAIAYGEIGDKNQIKDVLRRATRPVLRVLQKMGFTNAKFSEGRDFYDFLKNYQSNASKGRISERSKSLLAGEPVSRAIRYSKSIEERMDDLDDQLNNNEIDYDTYETKMVALEKEEAETKRKEYEEKKAALGKEPETKKTEKKESKPKTKEVTEISEAAAKAKAKLDAIGNDPKGFNPGNPAIYSELDKMVKVKSRNWRTSKGTIIDFTNKDKGGLDGFDLEEMVSYVRTSMIPYIAKFDPSKNNSLYGYINAQYANRMKAALKSGEVADVVFTEDVTEMTKLANEDVEVTKPTLPERKRFQNILESGVFSPDVLDNIQAKILPIVRTLKSKINEKTTLNRTVAPIIEEIRDAMGKQADIDIKKAMGGKENQELQNWLITNKKTVLENMTTTWLMGKDMGNKVAGGMPFAIQKRINGRWLNYPDWVGEKVDRESVNTDLAGRTAGHELVRRLPEVNKNVSTMEYLSSIIDLETGNPIRGRKESLAKALAEEVSFDIISDDFANEGTIFQAFQRNQELLGAAAEKVTKEEINRLAERGNIKYSLSTEINKGLPAVFKEMASNKDFLNNPDSLFNQMIGKIKVAIEKDEKQQLLKVYRILISTAKTFDKFSWAAQEKLLGVALQSVTGKDFIVKVLGGNNAYVGDIAITPIEVLKKFQKVRGEEGVGLKDNKLAAFNKKMNGGLSNLSVILEAKKDISLGVPITSTTANSLRSSLKAGYFGKRGSKLYNQVKAIVEPLTKNSELLKSIVKDAGITEYEITKDGNIKLSAENSKKLRETFGGKMDAEGNVSGGKRYADISKNRFKVGVDFAKAMNKKKIMPQDIIILRGRLFDYFNGYAGFDNFKNALKDKYNKDDMFLLTFEYQVTDDNIFFLRGYLNFNEEAEKALNAYVKEKGSNMNRLTPKRVNQIIDIKTSVKHSRSLENNLNSYKGINNIDLVSKYISENNINRISAEDSFDVLNNLVKEIENYWGVVPDNTITLMNRTIDYAFDVIEDRENEGGPLMAAVNDALNLETIKNAEVQLNKYIDNNKIQMPKFSFTTKANLEWTTKLGETRTTFKVGEYNYSIYMASIKNYGFDQVPVYIKTFKKISNNLGVPLTYLTDNKNVLYVTFQEDYMGSDILETGNAFNVLSIVTNGLVEYIQKNNIEGIVFTAIEPSRIRLYKTLSETIGSRLGWTYNTEQIGGEEGTLFLINTSKDNKEQNQLKVKLGKSLDYEFNDMLERNKNVPSYEKFSDIVAKRKGAKSNELSFFVPPSADDFRGLTTYMFSGKGKQGELDQQFFDVNLVIPYVKGINALDSVRQSIKKEYKALLADFPDIKSKLEKRTIDKQFTYDQAIRVYLWSKNDIEIPGLGRRDKNKLVYIVKNDPNLMAFADALSIAGRQDGGWMKPSVTWDSNTIISDLHDITEGDGRKEWLSEFIENANDIFTKENLNKIQYIYGTNVRNQLEDSLYRMKNGKSRPEGTDALTNKWMNWINGSTAAIMFFNVRSAILQTISSTNYLNWNDNNPLAAATAFANQKQYWADFATIINSDKMRERRSGLKADVTQAEIANAANSTTDKARGILSYLQKIGFTPTQAADSFSIAIGGASFYRNRVNTYLKQADEDGNLINTKEEAEEKAWIDFSMITDQSMQSADPMYVSKQQTTGLGRLVLAFANTPMQYNRMIKKASLDLVNRRGDWKTNISKIIYYGALQNLLFSALQAALFLPFEEEDEETIAKMSEEQRKEYDKLKKKQDDKAINILNGMVDTVLRGSGITGALIATIKNVAMEYKKQEEKKMFADHAYTLLAAAGISPPISSKARKIYGIHRIRKFEKDVIEERGWEITRDGRLNLSPNYSIVGNVVVATTNVPLDRLVEKVDNLSEALDSRNTNLQRAALALGWKEWELNVKNEENETIKAAAKVRRKEEGIEKGIETREATRKAKKEALKKMSPTERLAFRKKEALEKREKALKKRKRKMGGD
jgi:hypothetical protein